MGKRQVRIFRNEIILKKSELEGKIGHVILVDHVVHHGQILEITGQNLVLLNPRRHKHILEMTVIEEVVFDKVTEY